MTRWHRFTAYIRRNIIGVVGVALVAALSVVMVNIAIAAYSAARQARAPFVYTVDAEPLTVCVDGVLTIPVRDTSSGTVNAVIVYQDITLPNGVSIRDNLFDPIVRISGAAREPFDFAFGQIVDLGSLGIPEGSYLYQRVSAYQCTHPDGQSCQGAVGYSVPFTVEKCE